MNLTSIGMSASRLANSSSTALSSTLEKIASGKQNTTAKENPAAVVLSNALSSQMTTSYQAVRNNQETSNVLSIADGAMSSMVSNLQSMRALATHAANSGVTSSSQVSADQSQVDNTLNTIATTAGSTKYSDSRLFDGNKTVTTTAGDGSTGSSSLTLPNMSLDSLGKVTVDGTEYSLADVYSGGSASLASNPDIASKVIDQALSDVTSAQVQVGSFQSNTLESTNNALSVSIEKTASTYNDINGADLAALSTQMAQDKAMTQLGIIGVQNVNAQQGQLLKLLSGI